METLQFSPPRPVPPLAARRLAPEDAPRIAALYRGAGKNGAWCGAEDAVRAVFDAGAWWGGFADGTLALCAALVPRGARVPQAEALCGALWPDHPPAQLLLPPAATPAGIALAAPLLHLLGGQILPEDGARVSTQGSPPGRVRSTQAKTPPEQKRADAEKALPGGARVDAEKTPPGGARVDAEDTPPGRACADAEDTPPGRAPGASQQPTAPPEILAALPVRAPAPLLAAYFAAGWAAVRVRPLAALRPHYLFLRRAALPPCPAGQAVRRVYLPLADTLAVSRLLERGFCATALCRSDADARTLLQFERVGGACFARGR